jgi:hypothetical protein
MPQTQAKKARRIIKDVKFDVRFGAEIIVLDRGLQQSENATATYATPHSWIDALVGLFDDSPLNAEVLENEKRARELMDAHFVMPE